MKAIILETPKKPEYKEVSEPILDINDWVKIKVKASGLCGSDLQKILSDKIPHSYLGTNILGHEFAGQVKEIGDEVNDIDIEDRVTAIPLVSCDYCKPCKEGKKQLCVNIQSVGRDLPGAFAEYVLVPSKNVRKIPDNLAYEVATLTDSLAVAMHCYHLSGSPKNEDILIHGDGTIALSCLSIFHRENNQVTILGKHKKNLMVAKEFGGIALGVSSFKKSNPNAYDCVIEAVGRSQSETINASIRSVKSGGKIVVAGVFNKNYMGNLPLRNLFYKEVTLLGVNSYGEWNGLNEFDAALDMLERNSDDYMSIITHVLPLEKFNDGIDLIKHKKDSGVIKIVYKV